MAITTLDGVLAGMQPTSHFLKVGTTMEAVGTLHSHAYATGSPGAIATPAPGIAGAALTTLSGQLPFTNPVSGNSYLARFTANANAAGTLILVDRLWHNSGVSPTTTAAQTVNSAAWPARDRNGTTNGDDILIGIEVSAATTSGTATTNTTMSYTNSAGTAGKTATMASFPATAQIGTFIPFQLAAGDTGVRSIQSITIGTSYGGGTIHLVAYRVLSRVDVAVANIGNAVDALTGGFPRLYDNTVPMLLWLPTATTAVTILGEFIYTQG